ncbi:hypothetical protein R3P38DRAFT_2512535, partial [Favolaschia claudopus]
RAPHKFSAMSFSEYATPVATLKYSPQYFASLTFLRVQELDYPEIATSSIVKSWSFTDNIPSTALGAVIQPGELVPFLDDVLPYLGRWQLHSRLVRRLFEFA